MYVCINSSSTLAIKIFNTRSASKCYGNQESKLTISSTFTHNTLINKSDEHKNMHSDTLYTSELAGNLHIPGLITRAISD